uniref:LAGLIDADG endonuclease n=1 Tax=Morchella brunnea TaxID=1174671 RepID=A0A8K1I8B6_9PEZI|nr:LAGLIDADG endonuclease [Morchella brunnea]UBU98544.1 LAGLIDADG endonuclease [Morchella brunnea]
MMKNFKKNLTTISPSKDCVSPSLNDAWFADITDGEGSFTASLLSNSSAFRIRYILTQKWDAKKFGRPLSLSRTALLGPLGGSPWSYFFAQEGLRISIKKMREVLWISLAKI